MEPQRPGLLLVIAAEALLSRDSAALAVSERGAGSLDHLVGAEEERLRDGEAKRLGGLEVDQQLELRRLLDRQVGGLRTLQNSTSERPEASVSIGKNWPVDMRQPAVAFSRNIEIVGRRFATAAAASSAPCRDTNGDDRITTP